MAKIIVVMFLLIPLLMVSCDDDGPCSPGRVNLLESTCPAETIGPTFCKPWSCRNVDNLDDTIALNIRNFDCEVIECDFLRCRDRMSEEITDFTDITPLGRLEFSTLIDSDLNQEFECFLPIP